MAYKLLGGYHERMIGIKAVVELTGMSKTAIYRAADAGRFPQRIRLGPRTVRWKEREVLDYVAMCGDLGNAVNEFMRFDRPSEKAEFERGLLKEATREPLKKRGERKKLPERLAKRLEK